LILALLVVKAHAGGKLGFDYMLPDGREAVQLFYVISGFYMALVLNRKYHGMGSNRIFYSNRFLRLWPPHLVVFALVLLTALLTDEVRVLTKSMPLDQYVSMILALPSFASVGVALANIFVIGQDWLWLLRIAPEGISWAPAFGGPLHNGTLYSLNAPVFTVAIEAMFYAAAPFLLRRSIRFTFGLVVAGGLYHLLLIATGNDSLALRYHFFFSALYFFAWGACAYHLHVFMKGLVREVKERDTVTLLGLQVKARQLRWLEWGAYALALGVACIAISKGPQAMLLLAPAFALAIPLVFARTSTNSWDRFVGDLSYSVYLVHFPMVLYLRDLLPKPYFAVYISVLAVVAGTVLMLIIERPVDRWRQSRVLSLSPEQ